VFSHARIVCSTSGENNKNPEVWVGSARRADRTPQCAVPTKFALQADANCGSLPAVRKSPGVGILLLAVLCSTSAQDQEKKLVDRLLKPDMALQNDAQNKKFVGDGSASINKGANVGTFFVHKKPRSKDFGGTRDFSATQFYSQTYRGGRTAHEVSSQQTVANSKATYANQTARGVRNAPQSGKKVASREYAGNRPFLGEGTRQKSLNRQNEPLTIEQVRELLNKNK
jgi:hypothetical protein